MRVLLMCALAALAAASSSPAQTYITEDVTADVTWTASGSPYVIQATIFVESPSTLTIEPGVSVEFDGW